MNQIGNVAQGNEVFFRHYVVSTQGLFETEGLPEAE